MPGIHTSSPDTAAFLPSGEDGLFPETVEMIIFRPYGDKDSPLASNFYHGLWSLFGGGPTTDSHPESDYGENPLPDSYEAILHYLREKEPWVDKMTNLHPVRMKWADHCSNQVRDAQVWS